MADTAAPSMLVLPVDDALLIRLHGAACIGCGSTGGPLLPASHAYTGTRQSGRLGWPVVACPEHQGEPCGSN